MSAYSTCPLKCSVRYQFILALTPRELCVQTQLAHPHTLQEALELALEQEIVEVVEACSRKKVSHPIPWTLREVQVVDPHK